MFRTYVRPAHPPPPVDESLSVFRAAREHPDADLPTVLATVVRARGSTPRSVGSKMLIDPSGGLVGTVGGGCGEASVIEAAREVAEEKKPRMVRVDLTENLFSWSPAVCGGVADVLLEPVLRVTP
jgi:xanthine/CO dehydrogenase XdhC/CoxF family maturation factor